MARDSHPAWEEFEQVHAAFGVGAGTAAAPSAFAAAVRQTTGREVVLFGEEATGDRLFLAGDFGPLGRGDDTRLLRETGQALGLQGELRIKQRGPAVVGRYMTMEQRIGSVPVYSSDLTIYVGSGGIGYAISGAPVMGKHAILRPRKPISAEAAVEIVAQALHTERTSLSYTVEEKLLPSSDGLRACYHVKAFAAEPFGMWYGFIAKDGELLALYNVASAASAAIDAYEISPRRTPSLGRARLDDLVDPLTYLEGPTSQVWAYGRTRHAAVRNSFVLDPGNLLFDQPQLYYFLHRCRTSLSQLPGSGRVLAAKHFNPMVAFVHNPQPNNAFFLPNPGELFFGDILGDDGSTRFTSRSLDIVLHEYGHALSDAICQLGRTPQHTASRAMSEGYSDYFAATILDNPVIGDYFMNDADGFRSCANTKRFSAGFAGKEHAVGEIWAGYLWSLRSQLGKQIVDPLVLQSLTYLGPGRTIIEGRDAILQADRVIFPDRRGGATHDGVIRSLFDARMP